MAETPAPIDPDRILEHPFTAVRRGYDPLEVQRYLLQIANHLRSGRDREADLRRQLDESEERTAPIDQLDQSELTRLLGQETARVLEAAQSASTEIRAKAEENVARLLREARDESQQIREESETVLARKTGEAETAAAAIRAEAETVIEKARAEASDLVEAGRQEGREMVGEAQKVRQRMLDDLSRRRKLLRQQIEQLQAGRDRLLAAYDVVRETLDVATEELHIALPEAKLAAETAALTEDDDDQATFDAEVDEAKAATLADDVAAAEAADADAGEAADADADGDGPDPAAEAGGDDPEPDDDTDDGDTALGSDEPVGVEGDDTDSLAPDPVEGRHSSSVTVVRAAGSGATAVDTIEPEAVESDEVDDADEIDEVQQAPSAKAGGPGSTDKAAAAFARLRRQETVVVADDGLVELEVIEEALVAADGRRDDAAEAEAPEVAAVVDDGPIDPDQELLARRDAAVADLERNLSRRLKRELSDEQNELLAALSSAKGTPSADEVLPPPEAHVERFQAIALPSLAAAATAGADLVSTVAGPAAAPTSVADLAAEVAADIVAPLRDRLERAFADGGGHPDDVAQSIRSSYREWKGQRVDQIASHAVVAASNRGLLDRLPEGTLVRWVVAEGDSPSPDCDDNALAGTVTRGEAFPTGHPVPPLHATCRCMVVPVES